MLTTLASLLALPTRLMAQEELRLQRLREEIAAQQTKGKEILPVLECGATQGPVSVVYKDSSGQLFSVARDVSQPILEADPRFRIIGAGQPGEGIAIVVPLEAIATNSVDKELYELLPDLGRAMGFDPYERALYFPRALWSDDQLLNDPDKEFAFRRQLASCITPAAEAAAQIGDPDPAVRRNAAVALTIAGEWPSSAIGILFRNAEARDSAVQALRSLLRNATPELRDRAASVLGAVSERLVPEFASVIQRSRKTWSGEVEIRASENCRSFSYALSVRSVADEIDVAGGASFMASLHIPGVRHKYFGSICYPTESYKAELKGLEVHAEERSNRDGNLTVIKGSSIRVTGTVIANVDSEMSMYQVNSVLSDPLIFLFTEKGYQYLSGSGNIRIPGGRRYDFP